MSKLEKLYSESYQDLQRRFEGRVEVLSPAAVNKELAPEEVIKGIELNQFNDISAPASELGPFIGRVVLWPNRKDGNYHPAVLTEKLRKDGKRELHMTVLGQPYVPEVGLTDGIMFSLGLKKDTNDVNFGAHTKAKGFEAGHITPAFIAVASSDVATDIINYGDDATHNVGDEIGGVAEKAIETGLLKGVPTPRTKKLDINNPHPVSLYWHTNLSDNRNGMTVAAYDGETSAVKLMLGAAHKALGSEVTERVGEFTELAIKGAK